MMFLRLLLFLLPLAASAQQAGDFLIKRVAPAVIRTPEYTFNGDPRRFTQSQWLEVETEFSARPEATPELTFRYYILFAGTLLTGEVTHVNIPAGQSLFSVMYVAPRTLTRFLGGRPLTSNAIENIAVQIMRPGVAQPLAEFVLKPGPRGAAPGGAPHHPTPPDERHKDETPFAPLYWDRYEAIKAAK